MRKEVTLALIQRINDVLALYDAHVEESTAPRSPSDIVTATSEPRGPSAPMTQAP